LAIESATYISDLNISNPPGSDPVGQADDHIRLLKSALKTTFPNINAAVSATPLQLNQYFVPQGAILMWSGSIASIPTGWALCNGGTYAKSDGSGNVTVPDLRDKFLVGAGSTYAVAATGGATSNTPTITVTNEAIALTTNQLPAHSHTATVTDTGHSHTATVSAHTHSGVLTGVASTVGVAAGTNYSLPATFSSGNTGSTTPTATVASNTTGITVSNANTGTGATHVHNNTATCASVPTLPPYYALAFIYKL
jgi:hypothetical protein